MLKILVSVKDNVADVFNDPHVEINTATAIRSFTASAENQPHKDDFSLYQIGIFDTDNGSIKPNEPIRIMTGHDVKVKASSISMEQQVDDLAKHEALQQQSGS